MSLSDVADTLSVQELKAIFDSKRGSQDLFCVIDVRQHWEVDLCHIGGSLFIPLTQLQDRLEDIPTNQPIFTLCHHGVRSRQAAYLLKEAGFSPVMNIMGGIDAWAKEIDPSMKTY